MAASARKLTKDRLREALKVHCLGSGQAFSEGEDNGEFRFLIDPGNLKIRIVDGALDCPDEKLKSDLTEILTFDQADGLEVSRPHTHSVSQDKPSPNAMVPREQRKGLNQALQKVGKEITVEDILEYLCPKATPKEAFIAVNVCKSRGMDPWSGDVHLIKYGDNPLTIVAGKEHFTKKAEKNPQFDGLESGLIVKRGDKLTEIEGTFFDEETDKLLGGWCRVHRKDRKVPFLIKTKLSSFNTNKAQWAKMPEIMINKVAQVQALRLAFPSDLGGVYDSSEITDVECEIVE